MSPFRSHLECRRNSGRLNLAWMLLISVVVVPFLSRSAWSQEAIPSGTSSSNAVPAVDADDGTIDFDVPLDDGDSLGDLGLDTDNLTLPDDMQDSELLIFEDIPVVVTGSRRSQRLTMSSVPISVVSAEDIHYGGFTSVGDMIQFVPGVDILSRDRNNLAVGVRGLHHNLSDRTLLLIDGRDGTSPIFGGADFYRIPVLPEDIKQIEVVRGPGGAAWGANAFNGVINIITKEPDELPSFLASSTINEFGDTFSFARWAQSSGDWSWRISAGYEDRESSEDAIINDTIDTRDFHRDHRIDSEIIKLLDGGNKLTFGASHMHIERGDSEFGGFPLLPTDPRRNERLDSTRVFGRLDFESDNETTGYVQWFGNYEDVSRHSMWDYTSFQTDIESQVNFEGDLTSTTLGGNLRYIYIANTPGSEGDLFAEGHEGEFWIGLFAINQWEITDRLDIEAQIRGDWYSETQVDWSGRLTGLYALDDEDSHILRASVAKAFRAPFLSIREARGSRIPLPPPPFGPGGFGIVLEEAEDAQNEEVLVHPVKACFRSQRGSRI